MPDAHWNIYTDESRQSTDRYMVLGGLALSHNATQELTRELESFRHSADSLAEFKWTKVSRSRLPTYEILMDVFFRHVDQSGARFHCMTVDKHELSPRIYHGGDKDRGHSVLYYNLLLHAFCRRYGRQTALHAHLDYAFSKTTTEELRDILNSGWEKNYRPFSRPFRYLARVDSKQFDLLQIADVILGAVGWHKNAREQMIGSSKPKSALARYIADHACLNDLGEETPPWDNRFTIWHWRPNPKNPRG